jgi:acyl-CoA reductase-like NAD-dependent aldehyde dehydrogenase
MGRPAAPQRAKLIRKLGDLIASHVPEIAQTETNDCGQVIAQTGKQLIPRAADNFTTLPRCAPGSMATPTRPKRI